MRWRQFCAELLAACRRARRRARRHPRRAARRRPAHPADPGHRHRHRARPGATGSSSSSRRTRARPASSASSRTRASAADMPAVSLWAAVPHYVAQPPCPKATLALLRRIEDLLELQHPPRRPARGRARPGSAASTSSPSEDDEIAEYVRALEEAKDTADLPEASGEAIAREFERYLKRRDQDSPDSTPQRVEPCSRPDSRAPAAGLDGVVDQRVAGASSRAPRSCREGRPAPSRRRRRRPPGRPGRRPAPRAPASTTGPAGEPRRPRRGARARCRAVLRPRRARRRSTPSRCGSGGRAAPAGSPSGRRRSSRSFETKTRLPLDFDIFSPSRPTIPACDVGAWRGARRAGDLRVRRAHLVVREDQVAAAALHVERRCRGARGRSRCTRCASRAGPRPKGESQPGSPGRSARHSRQSSGSFLPGRSGSPPRSAKSASISRASQAGHGAEGRVGRRRRSRGRRRRCVGGAGVAELLDELDDQRDRLDGADVVVRGEDAAAPPCRRGTARSPARRARASPRRSRVARSSSGSSTSVTFCT